MYTLHALCAAFHFVLIAFYAATTKTSKLNTVALKIESHSQKWDHLINYVKFKHNIS